MSTSLDCKILAFFCQARVPGMKQHTEVMILTLGPSCSEVHVMTYSVRTCAAKALIPDDDDEELIEKAKANRKTRLETEKVAEKEYAKTGGFADSEVVAVQASAALVLSLSSQLVLATSACTHCTPSAPCFGCRGQAVLDYWRDSHRQLCIIARFTQRKALLAALHVASRQLLGVRIHLGALPAICSCPQLTSPLHVGGCEQTGEER